MKRKMWLLKTTLLLLILLSACQSKEETNMLTFAGEGEFWTVIQEVNQIENIENKEIVIRYIGYNLEDLIRENIYYTFESIGSHLSEHQPFKKDGVIEEKGMSATGGVMLSNEDEVMVSIKWRDKEEGIILSIK